jgi:YidC/Oxa1 family membrane protein insertase
MPNIRVFLWVALAAMLYLNYDAWMRDYQPAVSASGAPVTGAAAPGPAAAGATPAGTQLGDTVPKAVADSSASAAAPASPPAASAVSAPGSANAAPGATAGAIPAPDSTGGAGTLVQVRTDVLDVGINLKGGELDRADLLEYPLHKDTPNIPVRLFNRDSESSLYVLQTGLTGEGTEAAPNHLALWTVAQQSFTLDGGADELRVPLTWTDGQGLTVTKTFVFKRGWYAVDLIYDIRNDGTTPRKLAAYAQILRHWEKASRSYFDVETYSFKGPAVYDGSKSRDLKVDDAEDDKFSETVTNGWLASLQHHFVSAIVPTPDEPFHFQLQVRDKEYLLSSTGPFATVPGGGSLSFREKIFVGPKLQAQLAATGPRLERTADYGKLTVIAQPLFATLNWVHGLIGNWGWSIIIVTALIKLLFYPLSQASGRSMAKMRAVGPRMKQIQDSYKDDKEKLGRAMMELYKKEKINPLAGCLPMVVQIPFFISFYWVLLESVEMRQAPFMLWVNDLSARDPYFVLPLFMGAAMFAQFKLNPPPPDPMQAKVMQFMPLVMTGMMAWFPAGLVLYWLTNTVLSIAQQWRVNQVVQFEANKKRA